MSQETIQIKRYPNRRDHARNTSSYVSLQEIQDMISAGKTVEITDSQTGDDLTRTVLTQIIMERQPEKMALFPADMLHFILRSNDVMSDFLRDYFQHSLTYLDYLQRHSGGTPTVARPIHWVKAWLDAIAPRHAATADHPLDAAAAPAESDAPVSPEESGKPSAETAGRTSNAEPARPEQDPDVLARRLAELEARLRQLESQKD